MNLVDRILHKLVVFLPVLRKIVDYFERKRNCMPLEHESVLKEGYSFVIVTDGKSHENLKKSVGSILNEFTNVDNYEIIVIGQNGDYPLVDSHIRYIHYKGFSFMPGWITYKKNMGALLANYDKLVIMHDYLALCKGWLEGYNNFTENCDVCTNIIQFVDGRRARDWTVLDYPGIGWGLLPYREHSDYLYISGAYFVVKTSFYRENLLDEKLRWGESEDVEWTCRIRNSTKIKLNIQSCCQFVKAKPHNEAPYEESWINRTIQLYQLYGYNISKDNFVSIVKNN